MKKDLGNPLKGEKGILAGDIGGTKTHLSLYAIDAGSPRELATATYPSQEVAGLEEMISDMLRRHEVPVAAACFGIACPVVGGACSPTNLSWSISEEGLRRQFGWPQVQILNDLATTAIAAPRLDTAVLTTLNPGQPQTGGNMALVAPGTGLGQALLLAEREGFQPIASEGGHADFAPSDQAEVALWLSLHQRFGHVSIERVLSGQGLVNIFEWLRSHHDREPSPEVQQAMESENPAAVITRHAIDSDDALCLEALQRFCRIFGAVAGNLALTGMTTGGVYLGGGIPPKILPALKSGPFMEGFTAKGRFSDFMTTIPVQVICEDRAALFGAAWRAYELATRKGDKHGDR
ncbi:MAG: glucokinase [Desulfobacterales bacterium]|nr:glucokinase [Desulfobacterales bacterium]